VLVAAVTLLAGCGGSAGSAGSAAPAQNTRAATPSPTADVSALPPCPALADARPRADGLPALRLECLGAGPAVRLSDLRGTPLVLTVWAAWCTNCAREAALFTALHRKAGDKLRFFGVHYKAERGYGLAAARDFGVFYPSVHDADGDRTVRALRATAPPQTFFVTADGRVAEHHVGEITSEHQLESLVSRYLGVSV
jgi:thiol-disulfide isomerase/thioredoxin